ncbi:5-carboxymethyl-2-hydroxymuconate Delta-isomerase [Vibrio hannami]|uniref:5-carboxymethyl-2-hydroxymuconate Delta-isomerase n=1 Tax=Vibrio hannami TaxID=2717094 RepID=UPI00240F804C|nr:5-carboxymethyl-2-hydroxymuconate Delta-isomerase [Vibrio hannami]MDG3087822.1 5-carboxymethyl-2-hydroxymuconate Delta-isomerase [Vibrio hannami]
MPHLIVEYSANIEDELDVPELLKVLNETAVSTGVFPLGGIRSRAIRCEHFRVAEGDPENAFIHLTTKVGNGRPEEVLKQAGDTIFEAFTNFLDPIFNRRYLSIGFELTELHPTLNYKKNNIHEKLKAKR